MNRYVGIMIGMIIIGNGNGAMTTVKIAMVGAIAFCALLARSYSLMKPELSVFDGNSIKLK